ncbi:MAG: hypothetical protein IPK57_12030 [Chitinophagaceae bacterium]|nr:hypothetical protein [Chitinophagaceae bacterium]
MDEGFIITSWISYYTQQPGNEYIEALEETTLACINYADIQKMFIDFPEFNIIARQQAEYGFYLAEQRTQILRKHTAEEKYQFFLNNHPTFYSGWLETYRHLPGHEPGNLKPGSNQIS